MSGLLTSENSPDLETSIALYVAFISPPIWRDPFGATLGRKLLQVIIPVLEEHAVLNSKNVRHNLVSRATHYWNTGRGRSSRCFVVILVVSFSMRSGVARNNLDLDKLRVLA